MRAMKPVSWSEVLTWGAIAAALALVSTVVHAQPPPDADPSLAPWFQSLRQPGTGIGCCSLADCRETDYKVDQQGRYFAYIKADEWDDQGKAHEVGWTEVPKDKILNNEENPTGRAVVCYLPSMGVLCFVRPSES